MVFGTYCMEIIIFRVWPSQRPKFTPSVSGVENTSSTSKNEYRPMVYSDLILSGKLYSYLADIDTQARNKPDLLVTQLSEKEGINECLKVQNQLASVGVMNNIRNRAKEIVLRELIYEGAV